VRIWFGIAFTLLFLTAPVAAQENGSSTTSSDPNSTSTLIQRLQEAVRIRDQAILNLQHRVEALERQVFTPGTPSPTLTAAALPPSSAAVHASSELYEEEERLARTALDRALIERGGILLPKWTMEVEHSATYYNSSSDNVSIDGFAILPILVVGDVVSQKLRRDLALGALTSRIGLPKDFQFEVRLPYGYESERRVWADGKQESAHTLGLGDLEVAVIKQFKREGAGWPGLLASARWKSTTGKDPFHIGGTTPTLGNGFNSIQGTLTAVKSTDPAILFGGFSYTANLSSDKGIAGLDPEHPERITLGHMNPGDTFGFNVGAAMSINPEMSLNAGWQQSFTRSTTLNYSRVPGSFLNEGLLRIGSTFMYMPGRVVDVGLGIGMTRDTPDFQFSVSFPFRFPLKRQKRAVASTHNAIATTAKLSEQKPASSGK
jgi:hypothetical protein